MKLRTRGIFLLLLLAVSSVWMAGCPSKDSPSQPHFLTPTPTDTVCTDGLGHTCTPLFTVTPTATATPTASGTPTATRTGTFTQTPTHSPTNSVTSTWTGTPTHSATVTPTATITTTLTATPSPTLTSTPMGAGSPTVTTTPTPHYQFSYMLGSFGTALGQFEYPDGIAATVSGGVTTIYVADTTNDRIDVYSSTGPTWSAYGSAYTGTPPAGDFDAPEGIALDPSGDLFVSEIWIYRAQELTGSTWSVITVGTGGTATPGYLAGATAAASDKNGNIYFANDPSDSTPNVQEYVPGTGWSILPSPSTPFGQLEGIAVDGSGNVFVADETLSEIWKFSGGAWSVFAEGTTLTGSSSFALPWGMAIDGSNNVYIAVTGATSTVHPHVLELNSSAGYVASFTYSGYAGFTPEGITVDNQGDVYVTDNYNSDVVVFNYVP